MTRRVLKGELSRIEAVVRRFERGYAKRVHRANERIDAGADVATASDFQRLYPTAVDVIDEIMGDAHAALDVWLESRPYLTIDELSPAACALLVEILLPDPEAIAEALAQLHDYARGPIAPNGYRRAYDKGDWLRANFLLIHLERKHGLARTSTT